MYTCACIVGWNVRWAWWTRLLQKNQPWPELKALRYFIAKAVMKVSTWSPHSTVTGHMPN